MPGHRDLFVIGLDNLKAPVKRILRGSRREETARFVAFRSHYGYEASFCNPYAGHEKDGVEGEGGRFRRNHLAPVPEFATLDEFNAWLPGGMCCRPRPDDRAARGFGRYRTEL